MRLNLKPAGGGGEAAGGGAAAGVSPEPDGEGRRVRHERDGRHREVSASDQ